MERMKSYKDLKEVREKEKRNKKLELGDIVAAILVGAAIVLTILGVIGIIATNMK